ncbi:MAG: tRNA lysidine(34) synthetase TilS [Bacteroidota bacterium]
MRKQFQDYTNKEKLFSKDGKVLAAVSGGIDSVVMLHLLIAIGFKTGIAHCNFGLRGKESDADEKFVKTLAKKNNVPFYSVKLDTSGYASHKGISIQMAARELRYEWLEKIRKQKGYSVIAVAHHSDDAIETFFINLVRGTGIAGLHGIKPVSGKVIRPLLFTNRKDIENFAVKQKIKYREDSSNSSDKYLRNKIRHKLIPLLYELNPDAGNAVRTAIGRISNIENVYKAIVEKEKKRIVHHRNNIVFLNIKKLLALKYADAFLFECLNPFGFTGEAIKKINSSLNAEAGKKFYSSTHRLIKDRQYLLVSSLENVPVPKEYRIAEKTKTISIPVKMKFSVSEFNTAFPISRKKNIATFDFDKLKFPLVLRTWKKGDFFYPFGMKGKKKLSDFFTDLKLSIIGKENIWLLCSGNDIVWVIGYRIDNRYRITDKTQKIFVAQFEA